MKLRVTSFAFAAVTIAKAAQGQTTPPEGPYVIDEQEQQRRQLPLPREEPYGLPTTPRERTPEALAGAGTVELGGSLTHLGLASPADNYAGALAGRLSLMGFSGLVSYRVHVSGALGGGSAGLLSRFAGDASVGPALALSDSARLFARIGLEASSHSDDALQASVYTFPGAYAGFQLAAEKFLFELGPRAGLALRSTYDPGNEAEGQRLHRRSRVRGTWGGTAALVSGVALFEASLARVEEKSGMWFADGALCAILAGTRDSGFVLCGSGQYWRAVAAAPDGTTREVPSFSVGASIGMGFLQIRAR